MGRGRVARGRARGRRGRGWCGPQPGPSDLVREPSRRSTWIQPHIGSEREGVSAGVAAPRERTLPGRPPGHHLVQFLATGGDSPAVRAELRTIETMLAGYRAERATLEKASSLPPPRVHPAWVTTKLERLDALLRRDPQRAKVEILKHLDGDLVIAPRPSTTGERRAEISGRAKSDSLLRDQEAVCLQVVAGAGFEPATFGLSPRISALPGRHGGRGCPSDDVVALAPAEVVMIAEAL